MNKIKKIKRRCTVLIIIFVLFGSFFAILFEMNKVIMPIVKAVGETEARNAATNVVKKAVSTVDIDSSELYEYDYDPNGKIVGINYNTLELNRILADCLNVAEMSLHAASQGVKDPNTHVVYYEQGIIYTLSLGNFINIAMLSDYGPKINIYMKVIHTLFGEIVTTTTPYGVNCTLMTIEIVIKTDMLVMSPFIMNQTPFECRIPLVIQIIQGEIPNMMLSGIS